MPQCSDDVRDINIRLAHVEQDIAAIKTAFVRNDLSAPDYDGHRQDHGRRIEDKKHRDAQVRGYLDGITHKIVMAAVGVALTIFSLGIVPYLRGFVIGGE